MEAEARAGGLMQRKRLLSERRRLKVSPIPWSSSLSLVCFSRSFLGRKILPVSPKRTPPAASYGSSTRSKLFLSSKAKKLACSRDHKFVFGALAFFGKKKKKHSEKNQNNIKKTFLAQLSKCRGNVWVCGLNSNPFSSSTSLPISPDKLGSFTILFFSPPSTS